MGGYSRVAVAVAAAFTSIIHRHSACRARISLLLEAVLVSPKAFSTINISSKSIDKFPIWLCSRLWFGQSVLAVGFRWPLWLVSILGNICSPQSGEFIN